MHPYLIQQLAAVHVADLRREAEAARWAASPRPAPRRLRGMGSGILAAVSRTARRSPRSPSCCPA